MVDNNTYRQLLAMALVVLAAGSLRDRRRIPDAFRQVVRTLLLIESALTWRNAEDDAQEPALEPPVHMQKSPACDRRPDCEVFRRIQRACFDRMQTSTDAMRIHHGRQRRKHGTDSLIGSKQKLRDNLA